ncbi:MAG: hypothetical protein V1904_13940 [Bacteroidota bacterium]
MKKIDYSKFKCEVYAPDGTFIGEAKINSANIFYCPGLVPGQKYDLVFSYDGILLVIIAFMSEEAGKVVYLSPGHILFNRGIESPSTSLLDCIKDKIIKRDEYHVPIKRWEKRTLEVIFESSHGHNAGQSSQKKVAKFKAGAALAKTVK